MKEFMSTSTDSSLSPGAMLLITEAFLRTESLLADSLLPLDALAAWLTCLGGRPGVLLTRRGLESRAAAIPNSLPPRDLSGEEWGEEEGALGNVAK